MNQSEFHKNQAIFSKQDSYEKVRRFLDFESGAKLKILDVGSGSGALGKKLLSLGHEVVGLDINLEAAKEPWVVSCDISKQWPVEAASFDLVICLDVAEHLENPEHILNEAKRVLKDSGKLIFGVPNHFDLRQRLRILFGKGIVHWDNLRHNQRAWSYAHIRFFSLPELKAMFGQNNWTIVKSQFNFMGGGIIPSRFTPKLIKIFLVRHWPNLFSGKFIFLLSQKSLETAEKQDQIIIPYTPKGL